MNPFKLDCVLFDLDGTLVDTAPDLIFCLNHTLALHGFEQIDPQAVKPFISKGAFAMIDYSAAAADLTSKNLMLEVMLNCYEKHVAVHSHIYDGMLDTLQSIEALGLKWGVVTNKRQRFTMPLMSAFNLKHRAACIVSGDTTANSKPHPEPMLAACELADVNPENCVYIGDASHDITAGKSAKMKTLAALYGYLQEDDQPECWGADGLIGHPDQILPWINEILCR
jgi:phosphoglycolate phosphatase